MRPTGILQDWSFKLSPEELLNKTNDLINRCQKLYDSVGNVADASVSYDTVLRVRKIRKNL